MGDMEGGSQGICLEGDREQSAPSLLAGEASGGRTEAAPRHRTCWSLASLAGVSVGW